MIDINGRALDLRKMNHEFFFLLFDLFIKLLCMAAVGTKVLNSVPFRPERPEYSGSFQKSELNIS